MMTVPFPSLVTWEGQMAKAGFTVPVQGPVEANREFAASAAPNDRWFKDRLKELFQPFIGVDQPVPANETVWAWTRDQARSGCTR